MSDDEVVGGGQGEGGQDAVHQEPGVHPGVPQLLHHPGVGGEEARRPGGEEAGPPRAVVARCHRRLAADCHNTGSGGSGGVCKIKQSQSHAFQSLCNIRLSSVQG